MKNIFKQKSIAEKFDKRFKKLIEEIENLAISEHRESKNYSRILYLFKDGSAIIKDGSIFEANDYCKKLVGLEVKEDK